MKRVLLTFLIILTFGLAATAAYIGYRLSQEDLGSDPTKAALSFNGQGEYTNLCGCYVIGQPNQRCGDRYACAAACNPSGGTCTANSVGSHLYMFTCDGRHEKCEVNKQYQNGGSLTFPTACGKTYQIDVFDKKCEINNYPYWDCGASNLKGYMVWYSGNCSVPTNPPGNPSCPSGVDPDLEYSLNNGSSWQDANGTIRISDPSVRINFRMNNGNIAYMINIPRQSGNNTCSTPEGTGGVNGVNCPTTSFSYNSSNPMRSVRGDLFQNSSTGYNNCGESASIVLDTVPTTPPTNTPTVTPTVTNTPVITNTPTSTPVITNTPTPTPTVTLTPTPTTPGSPTNTPTPTVSVTPVAQCGEECDPDISGQCPNNHQCVADGSGGGTCILNVCVQNPSLCEANLCTPIIPKTAIFEDNTERLFLALSMILVGLAFYKFEAYKPLWNMVWKMGGRNQLSGLNKELKQKYKKEFEDKVTDN